MAGASCRLVPHCWQKDQSDSLTVLQFGQVISDGEDGGAPGAEGEETPAFGVLTSSGVPHIRQTSAEGLFSAPHFEQVVILLTLLKLSGSDIIRKGRFE